MGLRVITHTYLGVQRTPWSNFGSFTCSSGLFSVDTCVCRWREIGSIWLSSSWLRCISVIELAWLLTVAAEPTVSADKELQSGCSDSQWTLFLGWIPGHFPLFGYKGQGGWWCNTCSAYGFIYSTNTCWMSTMYGRSHCGPEEPPGTPIFECVSVFMDWGGDILSDSVVWALKKKS